MIPYPLLNNPGLKLSVGPWGRQSPVGAAVPGAAVAGVGLTTYSAADQVS